MNTDLQTYECGTAAHVNRRTLLKAAGASGLLWLTPVAARLAEAAETKREPARSIIFLWLQGGPSQLETFDPHAGKAIAGETKSIATSVKGIELASSLAQTAELMEHIAIVRSVVSKEGDHERATYNVKTGYRPLPSFVHPSIGAVITHELPQEYAPGKVTEVPRHITILPSQWPGRGGYLGDQYDAFQTYDPRDPLPDLQPRVERDRFQQRIKDLGVVEKAFAARRMPDLEQKKTLHRTSIDQATVMMSTKQLDAFDVSKATAADRQAFGDTPFGRGCLAAARLVDVGVRCVEVTLNGWDTHANNHETQGRLGRELDTSLAALIKLLSERDMLRSTLIVAGGEFGRTPQINPAGGRDHWPHGFSMVLAGGGIRGGQVVGETDPEGGKLDYPDKETTARSGVRVADVHATILAACGITPSKDTSNLTPDLRAMKLSDGKAIDKLLS